MQKQELYLAHYGVKGMRWGVRKSALSSASSMARSASNISRQSAERKKRKAASKIEISKMSDKELQAAINRMNLECNYKNLKASEIASGREYVSSMLSTLGEIATIGASAASIAVAIYTLKNK